MLISFLNFFIIIICGKRFSSSTRASAANSRSLGSDGRVRRVPIFGFSAKNSRIIALSVRGLREARFKWNTSFKFLNTLQHLRLYNAAWRSGQRERSRVSSGVPVSRILFQQSDNDGAHMDRMFEIADSLKSVRLCLPSGWHEVNFLTVTVKDSNFWCL